MPSVPDLALGKYFFLENTLPSAPDTVLGKEFFFLEMSLPSVPIKTLGKDNIFFKFKTLFAECLILGTLALSKDLLCFGTWQSFFLASKFFVQPF